MKWKALQMPKEISCTEISENGDFLGLTDPRIALDEDEESAMLLYSKSKIFESN